jgi:hypothetical protein
MELSAGSVRHNDLADLWTNAPLFAALRAPALEGRCGACEYSRLCGGCRARPLARDGNLMGEDFLCGYLPAGGSVIDPEISEGAALAWSEEARARLEHVPAFVRRFVRRRAEAYARDCGEQTVTAAHLHALARRRFGAGGLPVDRLADGR